MRVNVYAEEMTNRVEIVEKNGFLGVRFYTELPVTQAQHDEQGKYRGATQHKGPFMHHPGDDDSAAVTFWSRVGAKEMFQKAIELIDDFHLQKRIREGRQPEDGVPQS